MIVFIATMKAFLGPSHFVLSLSRPVIPLREVLTFTIGSPRLGGHTAKMWPCTHLPPQSAKALLPFPLPTTYVHASLLKLTERRTAQDWPLLIVPPGPAALASKRTDS